MHQDQRAIRRSLRSERKLPCVENMSFSPPVTRHQRLNGVLNCREYLRTLVEQVCVCFILYLRAHMNVFVLAILFTYVGVVRSKMSAYDFEHSRFS